MDLAYRDAVDHDLNIRIVVEDQVLARTAGDLLVRIEGVQQVADVQTRYLRIVLEPRRFRQQVAAGDAQRRPRDVVEES